MASETMQLLEDKNVNVIEWPPKGADLSPIEACFREMQAQAKLKYTELLTQDELWEFVSELVFEDSFTEFI